MPNIPGHKDRGFSFPKAAAPATGAPPSNPMINPLPLDLRGNPVEKLQFLLVKYTQGASIYTTALELLAEVIGFQRSSR